MRASEMRDATNVARAGIGGMLKEMLDIAIGGGDSFWVADLTPIQLVTLNNLGYTISDGKESLTGKTWFLVKW